VDELSDNYQTYFTVYECFRWTSKELCPSTKAKRPTYYVTRQDGTKGSASIAPNSANLGGKWT